MRIITATMIDDGQYTDGRDVDVEEDTMTVDHCTRTKVIGRIT